MINKIKNKIKNFENRIDKNYYLIQDQISLTQLLKMFDENFFFPFTSWSINPTEVLHVCNDIVINKRRNIVEFGSGVSTVCIAKLLKINNIKANFYSIENNPDWAAEFENILLGLGLKDYVTIVVAPIEDLAEEYSKVKNQKWYDTKVLQRDLNDFSDIDLVLVDGPYWRTSQYARFPAIPFLKEKLGGSYSVFLDDTNRKTEQEIVKDWEKIVGGSFVTYNNRYSYFSKGASFGSVPYGLK